MDGLVLRVLTLNCWGLWFGSKRRAERMKSIVKYLNEYNYDIVFLQEVWVTSDFEAIRDGTKNKFKFAHLFRAGSILGSSGIVILCRWYPRVVHFEPYSLNGSPFYPWHGDWFAGKGIAYVRVDLRGERVSLHLFSTHMHAYYDNYERVHDQYSIHRICQSFQMARFINFISDTAAKNHRQSSYGSKNQSNQDLGVKDLLIVAGDINSTSSELPYKLLTTMTGLVDCYKVQRRQQSSSRSSRRTILKAHSSDEQITSSSQFNSVLQLNSVVQRNSDLPQRPFSTHSVPDSPSLGVADEPSLSTTLSHEVTNSISATTTTTNLMSSNSSAANSNTNLNSSFSSNLNLHNQIKTTNPSFNNQHDDSGKCFQTIQHDVLDVIENGDNFEIDSRGDFAQKYSSSSMSEDSETEDDDITYCHPRNSFTPLLLGETNDQKTNNVSLPCNANKILSMQQSENSKFHKQKNSNTKIRNVNKDNINLDLGDNIHHDKQSQRQSQNNRKKKYRDMDKKRDYELTNIENEKKCQEERYRLSNNSPKKRIDFILIRLLSYGHCLVDNYFSESKDPITNCSLSDHEPVAAKLQVFDYNPMSNYHSIINQNSFQNLKSLELEKSNNIEIDNPSFRSNANTQGQVLRSRSGSSNGNNSNKKKSHELTSPQMHTGRKKSFSKSVANPAHGVDVDISVMEDAQKILDQYRQYNRAAKTQLFVLVSIFVLGCLPTGTYFALANESLSITAIIILWFSIGLFYCLLLLVGFLCYRYEQAAIDAIINDMTCKIAVYRQYHSGHSRSASLHIVNDSIADLSDTEISMNGCNFQPSPIVVSHSTAKSSLSSGDTGPFRVITTNDEH